jgi:predicted GNAT family acetyltransferase
MPWHIEDNSPYCEGFAVVKDSNGEVEGCHRTRAQAEAQLAALNISEDKDDLDDEVEDMARAGTGPAAIITDIDDTVVSRSGRNTELIQLLAQAEARIIVITGRLNTRRAETEDLLDRIGLEYDELIMSTGGDPNTHKRDAAESLLSRLTILAAYDDNPDARAAYQSLGIEARPPQSNRALVEQILAKVRRER